RGFELVERPERFLAGLRRPVVVTVHDVAFVGSFLLFPYGVDVVLCVIGQRELDDGQDASACVVACRERPRTLPWNADLAALLPVSLEENCAVADLQSSLRDVAEVGAVHDETELRLGPRAKRNDDRRLRRGLKHAEDPDRQEALLLLPGLLSDVRDGV